MKKLITLLLFLSVSFFAGAQDHNLGAQLVEGNCFPLEERVDTITTYVPASSAFLKLARASDSIEVSVWYDFVTIYIIIDLPEPDTLYISAFDKNGNTYGNQSFILEEGSYTIYLEKDKNIYHLRIAIGDFYHIYEIEEGPSE